jgi:hypothetical protein
MGLKGRETDWLGRCARMRFKAGGAAEKAGIAIEAAERPDRQFGEEALEESSRFGPTSSFALTTRTSEPHGETSLK